MERGVVSSDELAALLRESNLDVNSISLERAIELYVRARKLERKRLSTIHVHWHPACQADDKSKDSGAGGNE